MTPNHVCRLRAELAALAEPRYQEFSRRLTPTGREILGVRVPMLRRIAVRLVREGTAALPLDKKSSHEEILIAGMILARQKKPVATLLSEIDDFLAVTDNWAVCDTLCAELKIVKREPKPFWRFIAPLFRDSREFHVRFACVLLLDYFLEDEWIAAALNRLASVRHPAYYARMGAAWGLSIAFIRYPDATLATLRRADLPGDIRQKAVRKILESFRVDAEAKARLRREFP